MNDLISLQETEEMRHTLNSSVLLLLHDAFRVASLNQDLAISQAAANLFSRFETIFKTRAEFHLKYSQSYFSINDHLFVKETLLMKDLVEAFENLHLSGIIFYPGIHTQELIHLLHVLIKRASAADLTMSPSIDQNADHHLQLLIETPPEMFAQVENAERIESRYYSLINTMEDCFSHLTNELNYDFQKLTERLEDLIDDMTQQPHAFAPLLWDDAAPLGQARHAVNTSLVSLYVGDRLGLDDGRLKSLGLAALLHDMGRLFLPCEFKTGYRVKEGDKDFVRRHVEDGAAFLTGVNNLPAIVFRVALEHHGGYDGQGYPEFPSLYKPHVFSQIVEIADFVSWRTTSDNFYHKPLHPRYVSAVLARRAGSQFNPVLVKLTMPLLATMLPTMP